LIDLIETEQGYVDDLALVIKVRSLASFAEPSLELLPAGR
jgi:hypothetical protein